MKFIRYIFVILTTLLVMSCEVDDFLDREPLSDVTPDAYLNREADLAAYTIARYNFPTHGGWGIGTFAQDNHTDNQATTGYSNIWAPGEWRVPQSGGIWNFGNIRQLNYFLETVVPRWEAGEIEGTPQNVEHYIGEAYFLRAYEYFQKVEAVGDFPIVTKTLKDDLEELIAESKRRPRNEVARFILSDLDIAIELLQETPPNGKNRISKYAALLLKSRVALHEGSWLTYHKGTPFVPGGPNWPGTGLVNDFEISIDAEIDYFLTEAMDASSTVADAISLVPNIPNDDIGYNSSSNPYFTMFGSDNLESYEEVLLWRDYDPTLGVSHNVNHYINQNGGNSGYTRSFVDNFLMTNGLPIYAPGSGYAGDDFIEDVKVDRDHRLQLFMKAPGELRLIDATEPGGSPILIGIPEITGLQETKDVTGYSIKKGFSYLQSNTEGNNGSTGSIVFRAAEAYLNYIEASYLKEGTVNGKATEYWQAIRERAGVNPDFTVTIAATDISKEAENDFAAYSGGILLSDPVLYNIRRERRSELMAEGMRLFDLKRWRALDQLKSAPHIIKGFKLWGPMSEWYEDEDGNSILIEPGESGVPNVSSSDESDYLMPYRINVGSGNLVSDGYSWAYAHYLNPIATEHFLITTTGGASESVIYQNPGWTKEAGTGAKF
ncbi:RagB/SusD family nutrient uptake outer membrane protein [Salinimicrobium tongyeongense]|uniref:RagB/SusD family nutrient uptake outer membrane protein n=1 Tax=Salinimicrobium tongyeongense TaxID=2809707 RepID=A0ABY6NTR5_9FLAO|nr:RagB/SusD family nutrient uptake outer membrane protein [Salinimicrobium tongyeongense]UZH55873.1 RagB/SusD family nutrient uptake outer membrane protein [Salinimicrobium tongyeongense]